MYKKKKVIFISIAAIIFIVIVSLTSNRSVLSERSTYSSEEQMKSALQGSFVYFTSYGDKTEWVINGNTATHIYSDGNDFKYNITKWKYKRGILNICLDTTTQSEKLFVSNDGCLIDDMERIYHPKMSGYYGTTCQYDGCSREAIHESIFCERHTCHRAGCNIKICRNGTYCIFHTCQGGNYGCFNKVDVSGQKCDQCKGISSYSTPSKNNSDHTYRPKKNSTSHKRIEMPDCDDYEDYEDFMDNWDGYMPDGSDAEDYWENW